LPNKSNVSPSRIYRQFLLWPQDRRRKSTRSDKRRDFLFVAGQQQFIYDRYDKFADLEVEARESLRSVTEDTPIGEADDNDLKKALKIVRATVKASERMQNLVNSVTDQTSQIMEDFRDEKKEEKLEAPEPVNPSKARMKYLLIPKPRSFLISVGVNSPPFRA
jgi:hypothetical protein